MADTDWREKMVAEIDGVLLALILFLSGVSAVAFHGGRCG